MNEILISFIQSAIRAHHIVQQDRYFRAWRAIQRFNPSPQAVALVDKEQKRVAEALAACVHARVPGVFYTKKYAEAWS